MTAPLRWPYSDGNRERNELIMIGLRHPAMKVRVKARQPIPAPGISAGLLRLILFLLGLELIVGAVVFWWLQ